MVEFKFDHVAEFTEEEAREIKDTLDKLGLASWGFLYVMGLYTLIDRKRLHPLADKYIRIMEKLIERYKQIKEKRLKEVV